MPRQVEGAQEQESLSVAEWVILGTLRLIWASMRGVTLTLRKLRWSNLLLIFLVIFGAQVDQVLAFIVYGAIEILSAFLRPLRVLSPIQQLRRARRDVRAEKLARWWSVQAGLITLEQFEDNYNVGKIYRDRPGRRRGIVSSGYLRQIPGLSSDKVTRATTEFARLLGAQYGTCEVRGGRFRLTFYAAKPMFPTGTIPYPRSRVQPTVDWLPVGVDLEQQEVKIRLFESNLLVAGLPGSGKSGFINCFVAGLVPLVGAGVVVHGIDPKMVELSPWKKIMQSLATEPEEFVALLEQLNELMDDRYRLLMALGLRKITPSRETPIIVLVIDELAEITATGDSKQDKKLVGMIRRLVQKGRAAGIFVLGATQRPASDILPTSLRDLFVQRITFALPNKESAKMILGAYDVDDQPVPDGPWTVTGEERGVGFVMASSDRAPRKFKTWWVSDERVAEIVKGVDRG